jgi:hypothetical protein
MEVNTMGKYLILWKVDLNKMPISREERAAALGPMVDLVEQGMKEGRIKDWGTFVGEMSGYSIAEGNEIEVSLSNQQWVPFCDFEVHPVASISDTKKVIGELSK